MSFPQISGYEILEKIGAGSFSIVYKAHLKNKRNDIVAIKCIDKQYQKKSFADNIVKEIYLLKMLKHDYIVEMKDFLWDTKHIFIITEYCNEGDLAKFIRRRHKLRESVVQMFMRQLATAMKYLRENNVCHMDLKPQNLLLTSNPNLTLKVADFGLSQFLTTEGSEYFRFTGSPLYMAPEKLLNQKFDARIDLWSVGVIMYECLFGRPPYTVLNNSVINQMSKQVPIEYPKHVNISKDCEDLLKKLLKHNPDERIEFQEFFTHKFLNLEYMPSSDSYRKAHDLIERAIEFDKERKYAESLLLYEEAIKLLEPLVTVQQESNKYPLMKIRLNEYIQWVKIIKEYLQSGGSAPLQHQTPTPLTEGNFESLCALASTTPALSSALDIGQMGEMYLAEGKYTLAFDKLKSALGILVHALQSEPSGLRRKLLHIQVQNWLQLAENIKLSLKVD